MEEQIQSLRSAMEVLDHNPEELVQPKAMDPEIADRYKTTVKTYLERKSLETLLNMVTQDPEMKNIPEADAEVFEETRRAKDRLVTLVKSIDEGTMKLQSSLALARSKRDSFEELIVEAQLTNDLPMPLTQDDEYDKQIDIEDLERRNDELEYQKDRLQRRKEQLMHQLLVKEKEHDQIEKEKILIRKKIEEISGGVPNVDVNALVDNPAKLTELEKENQQFDDDQQTLKTNQEYYDHMTAVMESFSGVRAVDLNPLIPEEKVHHSAKFELLEKYNIELKTEITSDGQINVLSANFIPESLMVRSRSNEKGNYLQLTPPPLQSTVESMRTIPWKTTKERLTYFFLETINMLIALEQRADELFILMHQSDLLTKIPKVQADGDQEIVCSMTHLQLSFSLHLTKDCPLNCPSVFLKEFVGFGGWKQEAIDHLKMFLLSQHFSSPVDFIEALRTEVSRMEQEENLVIPSTPQFSLQKRHEWD